MRIAEFSGQTSYAMDGSDAIQRTIPPLGNYSFCKLIHNYSLKQHAWGIYFIRSTTSTQRHALLCEQTILPR